uniref:Tctex1 domain-containing protein 1 n=1 Tax=Arion vulgaris TaxID=1028688 RepID=A0A0B6ZH46_9EUPU
MATEKLTEIALERRDKVHPKLQPVKKKASTMTKDETRSTKDHPNLISHSESMKSLATDAYEPSFHLEGQNSKSSLSIENPRTGMSVFRVIQAARTWKRLAKKESVVAKPKLRLENTYRLDPDPGQIFRPDKVEYSVQEILTRFLKNFKYTPEDSKRMCVSISSEIKSRVKKMNLPRYKIVSHVIIMQNRGQGSNISSRCLWATSTDCFASLTFRTQQMICVANVYGVYFE